MNGPLDPEIAAVVAGFPAVDIGDLAAARAAFTGVPADLHHYAGTVHGFDVLPTSLSQEARDNQTAALRRALRER